MSQKTYLYILRFGVYLSLISVFLVFRNLLFPYITSKQIFFNILVEILFVFWLAFIIKYPEYRPKKNYVTIGLLAFFAAMLASLFATVDLNLSFWGDIERMLGIFPVLHFLAFYLIIITVFRKWSDWKILFILSIIFAVFVSVKGLTGNPFSTIGNTAYVAGYLIFNMYFCLLLFFREKNKILRWAYLAPIVIMLLAFKRADSTGGFVGLGGSAIFVFLLYALASRERKLKIATLSIFFVLVLAGGFLFANKEKSFVKNNEVLQFVSGITAKQATFQTRLISWRAAAKDFKEHPILGVGWGNYAMIFDKHFDPKFYNYTDSETYFDRAHNNLIDIGSTTGLVGLLSYLSIFVALAFYLVKGYREGRFGVHDFALILTLISAYFVQNLAVFDSLVTYMMLMISLGFVYYLYEIREEKAKISDKPFGNPEAYILAGVGLVMAIVVWQYNVKVYKMLDLTIQGQRYYSQGDIEKTIGVYREALSLNTVLDRDSRTSLNRVFASNPDALSKLPADKRNEIIDYNIELAKKNIDYNPADSLNLMIYAQLLNIAASVNTSDPEKFSFYSERALDAINRSIAATPGRIPVYFQKAQVYITRGQQEEAIATLKYAAELNMEYSEGPCYLARTLFFYQREEEGYEYMDKCLEANGAGRLAPIGFVQAMISHYAEKQEWPKVAPLYERLIQLEPGNVKYYTGLARLYADMGEKEKARQAAEKAIEVDPSIKEYAEDFIRGLGL